MIDSAALLADARALVKDLERDLREQSETDVAWAVDLRAEHRTATERGRTALTWIDWRDGKLADAAVSWVLACVFVRFCEDNHLLDGHPTAGREPVWIGGADSARAVEHEQAHYEAHPTDHARDWLQRAFGALADLPAGGFLDRRHNPVWRVLISAETATRVLRFWREGTHGTPHDFADPELGTRFLGDLYQDLSEHAKKTYALLQTPDFIEEFILDRTLTPALAEFGLEQVRMIDPTCGSGHFLLGAFARLDAAWQAHAPGLAPRERVQRVLDAVHGVDLNPFAVAIARFRLTVAALRASGDVTLSAAPAYRYHLAVGDSLLGMRGQQGQLVLDDDEPFAYASEDVADSPDILRPDRYDVVVGNPPYITVKDKALSEIYRAEFPTCHRQYALSVPFMELFFRLARRGEPGSGAGYVGQITSNSFMKREFGVKLIERLLSGRDLVNPVDLTNVIDTSGAYIPGHGTPTVILVGRRRRPVGDDVRAVLGVRGEPGQPEEPARGLVWSEIAGHVDDAAFDGTYVTVTALPRETLTKHPWSLSGGGASETSAAIEAAAAERLSARLESVGRTTVVGDDDAWIYPDRPSSKPRLRGVPVRGFVVGDAVRDYGISACDQVVNPYIDRINALPVSATSPAVVHLWPMRAVLERRSVFSKSFADRGLPWWVHLESYSTKLSTPLSITFAFVATHNHFVLDRGGKVFKQSAPVIKLPEGASEDEHLALLAVLNSSTACFWLKQVSHNKGSQSGTGGFMHDDWEEFFEYTGTKLEQFPLPATSPTHRGRTLDTLAQRLSATTPAAALAGLGEAHVLPDAIAAAEREWAAVRLKMIFEQEELDWDVYRRYGLVDEDLTYPGDAIDRIALGERAFELVLARKVAAGDDETVWFDRHDSTPITELPAEWPADYRDLVERRLAAIEANPHLRLLERPEYKRRWATATWEAQQTAALKSFALDRLERADLWRDAQGARTLSVARLADLVRDDTVLGQALALLAGSEQYEPVPTLVALLKEEAVPFLAAYRYADSGLEKYREWQRVWDLQRREDAGEAVEIPAPPRYQPKDFRGSAWTHRGKLDVPKERFIAYPGLGRAGDSSPVLGWAGWDHAEQAQALARAVVEAQGQGADAAALAPLLAGLAELEPWLHQWHAELDPALGASPAEAITALLDHALAEQGLTRADLDAWRPEPTRRGRPRTGATA